MKSFVHFTIIILLCSVLLRPSPAYGFDGAVLPVPGGTKLSMELLSPISTSTSKKGDKFSCRVLTPAEYQGAIAEGRIQEIKRSGKADKDSKINLEFDSLTMLDGRVAELNATVVEVFDVVNVGNQGRADNEGTVRNKSTTVKTSVKRAVAGAVVGALIGGAIGGAGGAIQGAAIGASIGVSTVMVTRGPDLDFKEGTQFTVECNRPTGRKKVAPNKATEARPLLKPRSPDLPSEKWVVYTSEGLFSLSHPDNWKAQVVGSEVKFTPERGSAIIQNRPYVTHGVLVGVLPLQLNDLQAATDGLLKAIIQQNNYLSRDGELQRVTIGGRPANTAMLSGKSPFSTHTEVVRVHVALLSNGRIFYAVTIVPQQESVFYQATFDDLLKSIQFRDQQNN